jgi:CRP/FNR family transcriptional regulator, cyclic AMP receptor protein
MSIRMTRRNGGAGMRGRSIRPSDMAGRVGGAAGEARGVSPREKTPEDVAVAASLLGRLPLFSGCTTEELERLAKSVHPASFHAGERLCVAGGDSSECYVVAEGEAVVTVGDITVDRVGPEDVVGERGPITGRPRAATVTADTQMRTYAIPRDVIRGIVDTSPVAATVMRDELLRRYG